MIKNRPLTEALGHISDGYVLEAMPEGGRETKHRAPRRCIIACALLICFLAVTACAVPSVAEGIRGWLFRTEYRPDNFSYRVSYEIDRIPVSALSPGVQALSSTIIRQYENYKPYMNVMPGIVYLHFDRGEDAVAFLGCDRLLFLPPDATETGTEINVSGDANGRIHYVSLWTRYQSSALNITAVTQLYTEHFDGETSFGGADTKERLYEESTYLTAQGITCHIVKSRPTAEGHFFCTLNGYLIVDGIAYALLISYPVGNSPEPALQLLQTWADQFPAK